MANFNITKIKKLFLIIIWIFLSQQSSHAQSSQWINCIGAGQNDLVKSVKVDGNGYIYSTGSFQDTVNFNGVILQTTGFAGTDDVFITKHSSNGSLIWAKSIGDNFPQSGTEIEIDNTGNIYLIGSCMYNGFDMDPGPGISIPSGSGGSVGDIFILKLNNNGNFVWAKGIGGSGTDYANTLSIDLSGNLYISGSFSNTVDFDPGPNNFDMSAGPSTHGFLLKLNNLGNFIWAKQFSSTNSVIPRSQQIDNLGNLYLMGHHAGTTDFDPSNVVYNLVGSNDMFICKLDVNGNFIWAKSYGTGIGTGYQGGHSLDIDNNYNVYVTGSFENTVNFNPTGITQNLSSSGARDILILKLDSNGNYIWSQKIGGLFEDYGNSIKISNTNQILIAGLFSGQIDLDPTIGTYNAFANNNLNIFNLSLDLNGNFLWATTIDGNFSLTGQQLLNCPDGSLLCSGNYSDTVVINNSNFSRVLISNGGTDILFFKHKIQKINGVIFNDINQNCSVDINEIGLSDRIGIVNPGNIIVQTDINGRWYLDSLPIANYTITYNNSNNWTPTCPTTMNFIVTNPNDITNAPPFGLISTQPCPQPEITISAPFLRRCFSNQTIYVQACNQNIATGVINSAYIDVVLDSLLSPTSASLTYTSLGNNKYRFNIGNLNPGQCTNFTINTTVSCDAILNQTLCMKAELFPFDSCVLDTPINPSLPSGPGTTTCNLPWDHSSLSVDGYCANDSVYFTITNTGSSSNGNMLCYAPIRVYIDGVLTYVDSIMLGGGQTITYSYPSDGQTWILQADQHPLHPGNSHPNAHVEACGNLSNWTPNLVNILPLDDADPIKDVYCGLVSGSYDPNDKTGFPTGLGTLHEILPNQQIQYQIRFQNTGNDTAFKIVIRDTLDTDLNIFSVVPGVASHAYSFRMYGPRVLEWTFNNIMLPDSNINEPLSHGFATFRVDQEPNLANGTTILNDADIYFDFNDPIITNETVHTINNQLHNFAVGVKQDSKIQEPRFKVYPNPANELLTLELLNFDSSNLDSNIKIENVLGQVVYSSKTKQAKNSIDISKLTEGIYIITVESKNTKQSVKVVKY